MISKEKLEDLMAENFENFRIIAKQCIADLYHDKNFIKTKNDEDINYKLLTALMMMMETRLSMLEDDLNHEDKTIQ